MARVWKNWCVDKEIINEIENYEPAELNTLLEHFYAELNNKKSEDHGPESLKVMMESLDRYLKNKLKAAPFPLYVTGNLVRPKRCWRTKQKSFAWLAAVSAQTKLGKYQRRKKKFSGRAENSEVLESLI